jgi:hypothetical protein
MPSFSKECLGGFVGFQGVAPAPNAEVMFLQTFAVSQGREAAAGEATSVGFVEVDMTRR